MSRVQGGEGESPTQHRCYRGDRTTTTTVHRGQEGDHTMGGGGIGGGSKPGAHIT